MIRLPHVRILGIVFSFAFLFSFPAYAKGDVLVSESQDYAIFFHLSGNHRKVILESGKKQKMVEMIYKFVNRAEDPTKLFKETGWVSLRFQDKRGFDLIKESIRFKDLEYEREKYGWIWLDKKKAKRLNQAVAVSVEPTRAKDIQRIESFKTKEVSEVLSEEASVRQKKLEAEVFPKRDEGDREGRSGWFKRALSSLNPLRVFKRSGKKQAETQVDEKSSKWESRKQERSAAKSVSDEEVSRQATREIEVDSEPVAEEEEPAPVEEEHASREAEEVARESDVSEIDEEEAPVEEEEVSEYEDTEATVTLDVNEERISEADIQQSLEEFNSTSSDDLEETYLDGAFSNEDVSAVIKELEDSEPTIQ